MNRYIFFNKKQNGHKRKNKKLRYELILDFLEYFIVFFGEGLQSNSNPIKLFCGRLLFHIIKCLPKKVISQIDRQIFVLLTKSIIGLLPTHKQLFIKISSLVQYYSSQLRCQIKRMAHQQPNDNIRKLAISNLLVNNLDEISDRLRDRNKQNRLMCIKKMRKNQICIEGVNGWKTIYDGISSRDPQVQRQFVYYIVQRINNNTAIQETDKHKKRSTLVKSKQIQKGTFKSKLTNFFKSIDLQQILVYPHLNRALTQLISQALLYISQPQLIAYFRQIFSYINHKKQTSNRIQQQNSDIKPNRNALKNVDAQDMFILRCICNVFTSQRKGQLETELVAFLQQFYPCSKDLQLALQYFHQEGKLFMVYQTLQIISFQINIDQGGRQKLRKVFKNILLDTSFYKNQLNYNKQQYNDVYYELDERRLKLKALQQGQCDISIIKNNLDLIPQIVKLFKKYSNQSFFQTQLCQITSEVMGLLNVSDQNQINLYKRYEIAENKFKECLKIGDNQQTIKIWKQQADKLKIELQYTQVKSCILLKNIAYHCKNPLMQIIHPLKQMLQHISPNTYCYALCLQALGTFCLLNKKLAIQNYSLFIRYLPSKEPRSLQKQYKQVVSLKIVSDMIQRYNLLKNKEFDNQDVNSDLVQKKIASIMFMPNQYTRNMAIEIVSKLLFNHKMQNENIFFVYLLLLWWDTKVHKDSNTKAVQIISVFFKKYPQQNQQCMQSTEYNFQIFFCLLMKIFKQKKQFNGEIIEYKIAQSEFIDRCLGICINIITHGNNSKCLFNFLYFLLDQYGYHYFDKHLSLLQNLNSQQILTITYKMQEVMQTMNKQKKDRWGKQIKRIRPDTEKIDIDMGRAKEMQLKSMIVYKNLKDIGIVVDSNGDSQFEQEEESSSLKREAPMIDSLIPPPCKHSQINSLVCKKFK